MHTWRAGLAFTLPSCVLEKVYADGSEDSDVQMEEERTRMRNHVMAEVRSASVCSGLPRQLT